MRANRGAADQANPALFGRGQEENMTAAGHGPSGLAPAPSFPSGSQTMRFAFEDPTPLKAFSVPH